ncbi:DNA adenine methylase [Campylobacter sp. MIT 21-1685]|uniref:DNA adenine methylase n=1 Tax=unclassified Campylobacter TaxID=2593542 RepID=UPI00224B82B9|nr:MULTISPECIES: DNA adenine methylase [unclassified Campylobacter]MCX2683375.1 DNA adenine methylase [Campylobacter sp. MIT 21-1684]MCX2751698.1 DNA adenine methylase [Campylobacter sp. MIT 21-1682]MCX2807900.1 DNA adenine methylase [Campylobacter sp. MIT 21-1685]
MRFIGNKEALSAKIYALLQKHQVMNHTNNQIFFDMFAGSASIGRFFKAKGLQVYSCDMLYFSFCLQRAYLQNNQIPTFEGLSNIIESSQILPHSLFSNETSPYQKVLSFLNTLPSTKGFIFHNYAPSGSKNLPQPRMYFSDTNAGKIDSIRAQIETWRQKQVISENEYFILLATLIESVSLFANVAGVYAAFCKSWDKRALKDFKLKEIEILCSNKEHFCFCGDSLEVLNNFTQTFDILYLDPPYNHRQYAPNYHLIETIAKYDNPKIKGVAGLREWQHQKSTFCNAKTALASLEQIASSKKYKTLVLSYNSEGIMQKEEINAILKPLGKVAFESFTYPRFKSNAKKGDKYIKEYVWIVQVS